ncbi:hypothetical protein E2C01_017663 [Portunus trituberculatus]|uniref:Uncharacterized protein n=1 Tax=Portunus trituberculatus TaxID=210409 RepID=A0A5B7DU44_PORTR|nr:hypothetical protein [Portunus trituberculatus]
MFEELKAALKKELGHLDKVKQAGGISLPSLKRLYLLLAHQLRRAPRHPTVIITGHAQLSLQDKTRVFALLVEGWSVIRIAADLKVTRRTIHKLKTAAENLWLSVVPARKPGSGAPRKMSPHTGKDLAKDYSRQSERETPQLPAESLGANYSTSPSEGIKIANTLRWQETASDRGYEETTSGFLAEIQGVDICRLAESNVQQ